MKGERNKLRREKMPLTEAQKRAKAKYNSEKLKRFTVSFYPTESELWEKLQEQDNKQGYIKDLIRKDLNK